MLSSFGEGWINQTGGEVNGHLRKWLEEDTLDGFDRRSTVYLARSLSEVMRYNPRYQWDREWEPGEFCPSSGGLITGTMSIVPVARISPRLQDELHISASLAQELEGRLVAEASRVIRCLGGSTGVQIKGYRLASTDLRVWLADEPNPGQTETRIANAIAGLSATVTPRGDES